MAHLTPFEKALRALFPFDGHRLLRAEIRKVAAQGIILTRYTGFAHYRAIQGNGWKKLATLEAILDAAKESQ